MNFKTFYNLCTTSDNVLELLEVAPVGTAFIAEDSTRTILPELRYHQRMTAKEEESTPKGGLARCWMYFNETYEVKFPQLSKKLDYYSGLKILFNRHKKKS